MFLIYHVPVYHSIKIKKTILIIAIPMILNAQQNKISFH